MLYLMYVMWVYMYMYICTYVYMRLLQLASDLQAAGAAALVNRYIYKYLFRVNPIESQIQIMRSGSPLGPEAMNEARLSHLPFWGPSEVCFLINSTSVGFTRMKRSGFGLRVRVNPWVNLGERFIRVNPTDV